MFNERDDGKRATAVDELFVADGYGNKRVAVLDADTGKMKRYWGAYGNKPDDTKLAAYDPSAPPSQQFRNPVHCVERSNDGLVYVCDRQNDRLQVFTPEGKFVKEQFYEKDTLGSGSVWDIAFSKDPQQKYIFMADAAVSGPSSRRTSSCGCSDCALRTRPQRLARAGSVSASSGATASAPGDTSTASTRAWG
mgnify:CR=1 FL=1